MARAGVDGALPTTWRDANGLERAIPEGAALELTSETGTVVSDPEEGDVVYMTFDVPVEGQTIRVSADTYPGTYENIAA